ncbi:MAG TPA: 4-hydroxy-tetrahydrodipicolinate synthase [Vicinamibacteria bacterium]|jgi:4-hydroxy-tetrahydrodipicolinate synthase|nr:4-hydroxy-tetrahydrodipicolinate synthase [Vicinamibacteria bacterium]
MSVSFAGVGVALVTPFTRSGDLDEVALKRCVRRQVEGGTDFLVPCGTTGESATLSEEEHERVIAIVVQEAGGKVPVLAGAGSNNTRVALERGRRAAGIGADGVLSVAPYYNKPTPEGFFRHFTAVAEASPLPVIVYNVPGRTGSNIDARTLLRIAAHSNIVGVKEASGNLAQIMEILRDRRPGFLVLSGDDAITLPLMALGAEGVISVVANEAPSLMKSLVAAAARGDFKEARGVHQRLLLLMNLNFVESSPVPVKSALALLGLCEESFRLPLCPPTDPTREALRAALRELGLLP